MQFHGLADSLVLRTPSYFCRDAELADIAGSFHLSMTRACVWDALTTAAE
jgi:hypothetical protein